MTRNLIAICLLLGTAVMHSSMVETTTTAVNPEKGAGCLPKPQATNINPHLDARDCSDYYYFGRRKSGVYVIRPNGVEDCFLVYCEMEKDDGGWTVIQRRGNYGLPDDYFYKSWNEYKKGFGILELEFWLGNDKISALTKQGNYTLKVDLVDVNRDTYTFTYGTFKVEDELELYKLSIGESSADFSNDIFRNDSGFQFSTFDRKNDISDGNCAQAYGGGWWYSLCGFSHLNGIKKLKEGSNHFKIWLPTALGLRYSQLMIRK